MTGLIRSQYSLPQRCLPATESLETNVVCPKNCWLAGRQSIKTKTVSKVSFLSNHQDQSSNLGNIGWIIRSGSSHQSGQMEQYFTNRSIPLKVSGSQKSLPKAATELGGPPPERPENLEVFVATSRSKDWWRRSSSYAAVENHPQKKTNEWQWKNITIWRCISY